MFKQRPGFATLFILFLMGYLTNLIDHFISLDNLQIVLINVIIYPILLLAGFFYVKNYAPKKAESTANKKTLTAIFSLLGGISLSVVLFFLFAAYLLSDFGGSHTSVAEWGQIILFLMLPFFFNLFFIMYAFNWFSIKISLIRMILYQILAMIIAVPVIYLLYMLRFTLGI